MKISCGKIFFNNMKFRVQLIALKNISFYYVLKNFAREFFLNKITEAIKITLLSFKECVNNTQSTLLYLFVKSSNCLN